MRQSPMLKLLRPGLLACLAISLVGLSLTPAAIAGEASTIVHRCTHGESLAGFSQQAYRKALRELPTEVSEYTDCGELIHKAQLAGAGHHGGGLTGGGGGPSGASPSSAIPLPLSPTEQRAVQSAHHQGAAPVPIGGQAVTPGTVHANIASAVSSLPNPLLALLAFTLAFVVILLSANLRDRVRTHRSS